MKRARALTTAWKILSGATTNKIHCSIMAMPMAVRIIRTTDSEDDGYIVLRKRIVY